MGSNTQLTVCDASRGDVAELVAIRPPPASHLDCMRDANGPEVSDLVVEYDAAVVGFGLLVLEPFGRWGEPIPK